MKRSIKLLAGLLAFGLAAGCSKEPVDNGQTVTPPISKDAVYINVDLKLATSNGTRSNTVAGGGSSSGTEIGQNFENNVNTLLLVLATTDDKYITHASIGGLSTDNKNRVDATMAFDQTKLSIHYLEDQTQNPEETENVKYKTLSENTIHVYAFCNYTEDLLETVNSLNYGDNDWINKVCTVVERSETNTSSTEQNKGLAIWAKNNFLMSNADNYTFVKKIPRTITEWQENYTSEDKPFHLSGKNSANSDDTDLDNSSTNGGAINVERSVARFDFKDGSGNDNTYTIRKGKNDDGTENEKIELQVQLVRMALTNMSKNFYYVRRISEAEDGYSSPKILYTETPDNYVVDTDAAEKANGTIGSNAENGFSKYFNFCLGNGDVKGDKWTIDATARNQWFTNRIVDVLGQQEDDDNGWTANDKQGYHIWRYVTENTIPSEDDQKHGISTGVVFKGMLKAGKDLAEDDRLYRAINGLDPDNPESNAKYEKAEDYPIIYVFDNVPYVKWTDVAKHATDAAEGSPLKAAYEAVNGAYEAWTDNRNDAELTAAFKKAATGAGFTLYQASNDGDIDKGNYGIGYYFYYYYWNRHNDNGNPGIMGNMEFGVVRNNVYKLSVTGIKRLGHPRLTENDPDPEDPDDPDESGDVYLDVSVYVLPWVVRENNIEF